MHQSIFILIQRKRDWRRLDENERNGSISVERPPQCKALGVHPRFLIENKAFSSFFWTEIFKYGLFISVLPKKRFSGALSALLTLQSLQWNEGSSVSTSGESQKG